MKNTYIFALIFLLVLGYFLYVYFGIIFIVFIPPVFVYLSSIIKSSILFTLPKLIINGTIDEFFATDSWKFYWDALPGINYLQYVPNGNHGLLGSYQTPTIFSFYDRLIHSKSLPKMEWEIKEETFYISTDPNMPYQINLWTCTNPKARDFRSWEVGRSCKKEAIAVDCSGNYHIKTPVGEGYTASLVEVVFYHKSSNPFILSTGTIVLPEQYDFPAYQSSKKLDEIRIEELLVFTVCPI